MLNGPGTSPVELLAVDITTPSTTFRAQKMFRAVQFGKTQVASLVSSVSSLVSSSPSISRRTF